MSDYSTAASGGDAASWTMVALMLIRDYPTLDDAVAGVKERARRLGVPAADVMAFVLQRGHLPE